MNTEAQKHRNGDEVERLIEVLVRALDFDLRKGPGHQIVRANLVVGVLKDHRDDSTRDLERTITALEDIAGGSDDDRAMQVLRMLGLA